MIRFIKKFAATFKSLFTDQYYRELQLSWAGRAINAVSFMAVIITLILWVSLFTLLRGGLTASPISEAISTAVSCFAFFGGLILAIFLGGWTGNLLRRLLWRVLMKLEK